MQLLGNLQFNFTQIEIVPGLPGRWRQCASLFSRREQSRTVGIQSMSDERGVVLHTTNGARMSRSYLDITLENVNQRSSVKGPLQLQEALQHVLVVTGSLSYSPSHQEFIALTK